MKKLILFLFIVPLMMLLYPLSADAMKMSEPIYLGDICTDQMQSSDDVNGFIINGATDHKGKRDLKLWTKLYRKGCATYGKDELTVNVHYSVKDGVFCIGDKDKANTIEMYCGIATTIEAIKTDSGIVFYYINSSHSEGSEFLILGKLPDGRFIKYVDGSELRWTYHTESERAGFIEYANKPQVKNNMIIVEYSSWPMGYDDNPDRGKLCFPWDQKAQWFGVKRMK